MTEISSKWHLVENEAELNVTDFELQLWRVFHAFLRWQQECEKAANDNELTGHELSVLHVIRMMDRPKSISDVGRILNRSDTFNITYSIKKLLNMGLIEKTKGTIKKGTTYQMTESGINNTDVFVRGRKKILINLFKKETELNLKDLTKGLIKIIALYDEAGRNTASYKDDYP